MKQPAIPPESEKQFMQTVTDLAGVFGWLVFHTHDSRRSQPGFPDLFMLRGRRAIGAELKSARGKATFDQTMWLSRMRDAGIEAYLWFPSDKQRIAEVLR